ncbi:MAG: shikimate kinase [Alphaproteobacteria bacterium]|nr:shikimate kinase [Alphaproteobacteria bacterium]MBE8219790.1 shikimate kinase [Alphaproteobacteria bacterium]
MKTLGQEPIVLVGMMGAGKSSLGKHLAAALGLPFYDSDTEIEQAAAMSVADIFARHGDAHFRDGERRVIARLLGGAPHVLSIGGGAYCDASTRHLIHETALSIWLDMPLEELIARVKKQPQKRPLLAQGNLSQRMADLLAERQPIYAQADIKLSPHKQSLKKSVAQLLQVVQDYYK